ncbi:phage-related protein [Staphylococcus simulans]|uniref:phage tail family protein n=1 Tax=Staphylococcus simulans TaxID=1286 RepID=UPI0030C0B164
MGFTLYDPNLNKIEFPEGLWPLDFFISSVEKERLVAEVEGIPGLIDYGKNYKSKDGKMTFWLNHDYGEFDYFLLKAELEKLLDSHDYFYIAHNALPTRIIKITVDAKYQPERIYNSMYASLDVDCNISGLPFWKTKYTTQDIQNTGYTALVDRYGMADGFNIDYPNYSFTSSEFSVWNGGNVTIDYRNMPLNITIFGATSSNNFTVENLTTGEKFVAQRALSNHTVNLKGAMFLLNNLNRLRESNRKFIKLVPGENKIKISNGTFKRIDFEFPFFYK